MGKQEQKSQKKQNAAHVKKGRVIDRRHNRTVDQDHHHGPTKYDHVGGGVLVRAGQSHHGPHANPIRLEGGKFRSVSYQSAPPQQEAVYVKVGEIPPAPPTGPLPTLER